MNIIQDETLFTHLSGQILTRVSFGVNDWYIEFDSENYIEIFNVEGMVRHEGKAEELVALKLFRFVGSALESVKVLDRTNVILNFASGSIEIPQDRSKFESFAISIGEEKTGF